MDQQAQYKKAIRLLNADLKDLREKLGEAGHQQEKLEGELLALWAQVETAGIDAVQKFKTTQSFIDSCAEFYGTWFDDCLRQVVSVYLELDLFGITMDDLMPMTPVSDTVADEVDEPITLDLLLNDDGVVLAQPAASTPAEFSNEEQTAKDKADGAFKDVPTT